MIRGLPTTQQSSEAAGHPVRLVAGDDGNIKLTTETDFDLAEALLAVRSGKGRRNKQQQRNSTHRKYRNTDDKRKTHPMITQILQIPVRPADALLDAFAHLAVPSI